MAEHREQKATHAGAINSYGGSSGSAGLRLVVVNHPSMEIVVNHHGEAIQKPLFTTVILVTTSG